MSSICQPEIENNTAMNNNWKYNSAKAQSRASIIAINYKDRKLGWSTIDQNLRKLTCYYDVTLNAYDQSSEFKEIFTNCKSFF